MEQPEEQVQWWEEQFRRVLEWLEVVVHVL